MDDDEFLSPVGGVLDSMLSEHQCEGWLEGYLLTGRHALFNSYEAFIRIVDSMFSQHAKWLKVTSELPWRRKIASLNYLLASHVWQQDHDGFTHQDPGFLDHVINKKADIVRVYLPPDANCLLSVFDHCLRSRHYVNVVVAGKHALPQWLGMEAAAIHCNQGLGIWQWASNDQDIVSTDISMEGVDWLSKAEQEVPGRLKTILLNQTREVQVDKFTIRLNIPSTRQFDEIKSELAAREIRIPRLKRNDVSLYEVLHKTYLLACSFLHQIAARGSHQKGSAFSQSNSQTRTGLQDRSKTMSIHGRRSRWPPAVGWQPRGAPSMFTLRTPTDLTARDLRRLLRHGSKFLVIIRPTIKSNRGRGRRVDGSTS